MINLALIFLLGFYSAHGSARGLSPGDLEWPPALGARIFKLLGVQCYAGPCTDLENGGTVTQGYFVGVGVEGGGTGPSNPHIIDGNCSGTNCENFQFSISGASTNAFRPGSTTFSLTVNREEVTELLSFTFNTDSSLPPLQAGLTPGDVTVTPGSTVNFQAGLINNIGQIQYSWEVVQRPTDSNSTVLPGVNGMATLLADKEGEYQIRVMLSDATGRSAIVTASVHAVPQYEYNFAVDNVSLAQTVFHESYPAKLIQGKPFVVRLKITKGQNFPLSPVQTFPIQVTLSAGENVVTAWGSFATDEFSQTNFITKDILVIPANNIVGAGIVSIELNAAGGPTAPIPGESPENNSKSVGANFFESRMLHLQFFSIMPICEADCFDPPKADQSQFVQNSIDFMLGTYPVRAINRIPSSGTSPVDGAVDRGYFGILTDVLEIEKESAHSILSNGSSIGRAVGIVSGYQNIAGYFDWHGYTSEYGMQFFGTFTRAAVVEEDLPVALAHEVGHSFNLYQWPIIKHYTSNEPVQGYWVQRYPLGARSERSFMATGVSAEILRNVDVNWLDSEEYFKLFSALTVPQRGEKQSAGMRVVRNSDAIHVSGIYSPLSGFQYSQALHGTVAHAELPADGSGVVRLTDPNGNELDRTYFDAQLSVETITDTGLGAISVPAIPVSFLLPSAPAASTLEVLVNNRTVAKIDANGSALKSALDGIPVRGFLSDPASSREILLAIIQEVDRLLSAQSYHSARLQLESNLVPKVHELISGAIVENSPVEVTKDEMLAVITGVLGRMESLIQIVPFPRNAFVEVRTDREVYGVNERANITTLVRTTPNNPELEFSIRQSIDGVRQRVVPEAGGWGSTSARLSQGMHRIIVSTFLRPKREAKALVDSIRELETRIFELGQQLKEETDPDIIEEIEKKIGSETKKAAALEKRLEAIENKVGTDVEHLFIAN